MVYLPDNTMFIFRIIYNKNDTIIFPSTLSNLVNRLLSNKVEFTYNVHMLLFKDEFKWVPIGINWQTRSNIVKASGLVNSIVMDQYGNRVTFLQRKHTVSLFDSYGKTFPQTELNDFSDRTRMLLYFYHTHFDKCKVRIHGHTHAIIKYNSMFKSHTMDRCIRPLISLMCRKHEVPLDISITIKNTEIDIDYIASLYRSHQSETIDNIFLYETVAPIIDSIYSSLLYMNIYSSENIGSSCNVYRQLHGLHIINRFKFKKRKLDRSMNIGMYEIKKLKSVDGVIIYTKDGLLRINNVNK